MTDQIQRMFSEALDRINDADILAGSLETQSDSQAFIRVLAFEVLLKCALLVGGQRAKANHNYYNHWCGLPGYAQKEIMEVAANHRTGYTDLSNLKKLLNWYQFIFEKARYHYELYENYSLAEQAELGEFWNSIGAPIEEAVVQYHPNELECLTAGLIAFIEKRI